MRTSPRGIAALTAHEGVVPGPYRDSVGVWTYGIGHTAAAGAPDPAKMPRGMPLDLDAALAEVFKVFAADLPRYEAAVSEAFTVPLAQHEFDAAVSFHFNTGAIGRADWVDLINAGRRAEGMAAILNWRKPAGIIPRRTAEQALFRDGTYPGATTPVWQVDATGGVVWMVRRRLSPDEVVAMLGAAQLPAPAGPIGQGSTGPRVSELQRALAALSLYAGRIDGQWGPKTEAAVQAALRIHDEIQLLIKGD